MRGEGGDRIVRMGWMGAESMRVQYSFLRYPDTVFCTALYCKVRIASACIFAKICTALYCKVRIASACVLRACRAENLYCIVLHISEINGHQVASRWALNGLSEDHQVASQWPASGQGKTAFRAGVLPSVDEISFGF